MLSNFDRIFGKTLFGMHGQKWRDMRSTLSPIFTSSKMKSMFGLLSAHADDFIELFKLKVSSGGSKEIAVYDVFSRFTVDGIATAVLGFEGDCVKNDESELYKIARQVVAGFSGPKAMMKAIFASIFPKVYKALDMQLTSKETNDFFRRAIVDVMNERERTKTSRPDIIQLMLGVKTGQHKESDDPNENEDETNQKSNIKNLAEIVNDDEYWMAQGFIFFIGGFDTTATLLQATTYEMAKNPVIQEELYREISDVIKELDRKPVTYEALHKMKFMDMVISESLRKHPPFVQMDRHCTKTYNMDLGNGKTLTINKGDLVFLPFYQLHRDPEYFPNPEKFDPYRFSDENKNSIVSGTYLPFGNGPRGCIGK